MKKHVKRSLTEKQQDVFWSLLEAQRYLLLMYTSCAWFFCDLSGLEPVQNLKICQAGH